jgi:hypothetical protein
VKFSMVYFTIFLLQKPMSWASNELHYLSQAKFGGDPEAALFASGYENFTNPLFQIVTSTLVRSVPFEVAWAFLELTSIGILAIGLLRFSHVIRVSLPALLLALFIYIKFGAQSYIGGEWIIQGFEAKVPAYGFGFLAIGFVISKRIGLAWAFAALSVLMHPLVGAMVVGCFVFLTDWRFKITELKRIFQAVIPFVLAGIYLLTIRQLTLGDSSDIEREKARVLHALGRIPHHTAPFGGQLPSGKGANVAGWFEVGLLVLPAVMLTLLVLTLRYGATTTLQRKVIVTVTWLHAWIPIALFASWIDRDHQLLGPLYIFRPTAVLFLVALMVVSGKLIEVSQQENVKGLIVLVLAWLLAGTSVVSAMQLEPIVAKNRDGIRLVELIREGTSRGDALLVDFSEISSETGIDEQRFELIVDRGTLANFKFVPTSSADILYWWETLELKEKALTGKCVSSDLSRWDYALLSNDFAKKDPSLEVIWEAQNLALYVIDDGLGRALCG